MSHMVGVQRRVPRQGVAWKIGGGRMVEFGFELGVSEFLGANGVWVKVGIWYRLRFEFWIWNMR